MSRPRRSLALLFVIPIAGCHLSHERLGVGTEETDAAVISPPRDAGVGRPEADAWSPMARPLDAGPLPDAGDVLPIEPVPDGGPGEGPWHEPPPPPPGEPTLVPIGGPIPLDDATDSGGPPAVVWNGTEWGVAWSGRFRVLDADARPRSAPAAMPRGSYTGLDFAVGRYAVATTGRPGTGGIPLQLGAFDRDARLAAGWNVAATAAETDVARLEVERRWMITTSSHALHDGAHHIEVFSADDAMRPTSTPLRLTSAGLGDVRVAGPKSRLLVVWNLSDGLMGQIIVGDPPRTDGPAFRVLRAPMVGDSHSEVEVFRDLVAIATVSGNDLRFTLYDTRERTFRTTPTVIGRRALSDRRPGLAVSSDPGFFVACWGSGGAYGGSSGNDGVTLQVLGSDGTRWGEPLELVTGERNIGGVDCGWNGREIVVIWWRAAGDAAYNAIFAQRVRPTFL